MFQCDCPPDDCAGRVRLHLAGDRAAGDALARKFAGLVRSIVQRVLGPGRREEWDDACQAVFLRRSRTWPSGRSVVRFASGWRWWRPGGRST